MDRLIERVKEVAEAPVARAAEETAHASAPPAQPPLEEAAAHSTPAPVPEPPAAPLAPVQPLADAGPAILETRFGVNLSATTVRHRLDGVRRQWHGREVRRDDATLVFLMKPPRSYWQRWASRQLSLQVRIHLKAAPAPAPGPTEVSVAILATTDNAGEEAALVAKALSQLLLESIRGALQVTVKGRGQERLPWPHPLKLWPVHAGGRLGEPIECQGKDLSLNGIGFYMPGNPPPRVIRLQFPKTDQTPAMTVPARVVRVQPFSDGWHEVGAILLMR
jgi:hypothetical protein